MSQTILELVYDPSRSLLLTGVDNDTALKIGQLRRGVDLEQAEANLHDRVKALLGGTGWTGPRSSRSST